MTCSFQSILLLATTAAALAWSQNLAERVPRFEDYPVKGKFHGKPTPPVLKTREETEFLSAISEGVEKGWGVFDGKTGKEQQRPEPNFAGHYIIVNFGCGDSSGDCLGAAIVDARNGRVYRLPTPELGGGWRPYFGVMPTDRLTSHPPDSFHDFPLKSPLAYRVNSRLLIADTCEGVEPAESKVAYLKSIGCGAHYYVMDESGLKLIYRRVE
jgi:hypothetical protein